MKSKNLRLRNKLWKLISIYIRERDKGTCFTCGVKKPIKEMHAGHFVHGKTTPVYFDVTNINCQCPKCNTYLSGNLIEYTVKMIAKYGQGKVDYLRSQKHKIKKWKIKELESLIEKYK